MEFVGASLPLSESGLQRSTDLLHTGAAEIWTLLSVETQGCGFLNDRRPLILFERHIFHQQTGGSLDAAHPLISSPVPGGYLGGAQEYERLQQAISLNRRAALHSASWGIGQIMGLNAKLAGFESVETMVSAMQEGEDAQLMAVAQFLRAKKLNVLLARHDWQGFARKYNGPNFKRNQYDTRLAAALAGFSSGPLPQIAVRQAQVLLMFLGIDAGGIDGIPGKRTRSAVAQFREQHGLGTSAIIDDALIAALVAETRGA